MTETIVIHEDTFRAVLIPDQMARLPTKQLVRLFVIMFLSSNYIEENQESVETLTKWIPEEMTKAKDAWEQANRDYEKRYQIISYPRWQTPAIQAQKALNRQLTNTVRKTRDRYKDIQKIQKCFNEAQNHYKRSKKL